MPQFNRRGFLQLLGAASAAPLLPALPARAGVAGMSTSKALWAGIYAKSGSVSEFVGVARGLGLSNAAVQGVSARSVGVRVAVATTAQAGGAKAQSFEEVEDASRRVMDRLEQWLSPEDERPMADRAAGEGIAVQDTIPPDPQDDI